MSKLKVFQNIHLAIVILLSSIVIFIYSTTIFDSILQILGYKFHIFELNFTYFTGGKPINELPLIYRLLAVCLYFLIPIYSMLFWIKFYKKKTGKEFLFMKGLLKWYIGSIVIFGTWSLFCIYVIYPHFS